MIDGVRGVRVGRGRPGLSVRQQASGASGWAVGDEILRVSDRNRERRVLRGRRRGRQSNSGKCEVLWGSRGRELGPWSRHTRRMPKICS